MEERSWSSMVREEEIVNMVEMDRNDAGQMNWDKVHC